MPSHGNQTKNNINKASVEVYIRGARNRSIKNAEGDSSIPHA